MASPQYETFAASVAAQRTATLPSLEELRAGMDLLIQTLPAPDGTAVTPVDAGGVPAEWVASARAGEKHVVIHLHGGGYCIGSAASIRNFAGRVSAAAEARVLSVDYRLAPEHPFPAAVSDAVAAYRWVLAQGISPSRISLSGESAGGGLAVALLVALRDAGDPLPACAVPISPWVDMENSGEMSEIARAQDLLRIEHIELFARTYLNGSDPRDPLASPLHADLSGLPPLLVLVGGREILLDDARRLTLRAQEAGVDCTLRIVPEMIHFWNLFGPLFPEAALASEDVAEFVRSHVAA